MAYDPTDPLGSLEVKKTSSEPPKYTAFVDQLAKGELSREEAVSEASRLSGISIYDVGNTVFDRDATNKDELGWALKSLVYRVLAEITDRPGSMPTGINHIVIGHAGGSGRDWTFLGNKGKVSDYVNKHVPEGEKVWVLACDSNQESMFNKLEGRELISSGPQKRGWS